MEASRRIEARAGGGRACGGGHRGAPDPHPPDVAADRDARVGEGEDQFDRDKHRTLPAGHDRAAPLEDERVEPLLLEHGQLVQALPVPVQLDHGGRADDEEPG